MPSTLRRLAEDSANDLNARFDAACSKSTLQPFASFVRERSRLSINLPPKALNAVLESGAFANALTLATRRVDTSGGDIDKQLRSHLGRFCEARRAFEERYGPSGWFHYAALNAGGLGITRFGHESSLCAVLEVGLGRCSDDAVVLSHDSLSDLPHRRSPFHNDAGEIDDRRLAAAVSIPSDGHRLAALKHEPACGAFEPEGWPALLCNGSDYVEVLLEVAPRSDELDSVRVDENYARSLEQRALNCLGQATASRDAPELVLLESIRDRLRDLGVDWVEVRP